jgi:predicted peptidase
MTIALTEYFLENYNIDSEKVYLEGYSGGGETGSIVIGIRPELYTAYLLVSSKWDGDMSVLVSAKSPVYMVTGENDSYYGSEVLVNAYNEIYDLYAESGMSEDEISKILILDLKEQSYYSDRGISDQHAGGGLIADDSEIMGWLFGNH